MRFQLFNFEFDRNELFGVIAHSGKSFASGHNTTYLKSNANEESNGDCFHFNDHISTLFSPNNVEYVLETSDYHMP